MSPADTPPGAPAVEPENTPPAAPPEPPAPTPPVAPPVASEAGSRTVEARLEGMETAVGNLLDTLTGLIGEKAAPEARPVKKPWTAWGTKTKDDD